MIIVPCADDLVSVCRVPVNGAREFLDGIFAYHRLCQIHNYRMEIFDSHVHFVDPSRGTLADWPTRDDVLFKSHRVADLKMYYTDFQLTGCVWVETSRRSENDDWLLVEASKASEVSGVVLNLQPDQEAFAHRFERACSVPEFLGIRLRPIESYDLECTQLRRNFKELGLAARTVEFGAKAPSQKKSFAELAKSLPGVTWILDHCGHPTLSSVDDPGWRSQIAAIAARPNVACKISSNYAKSVSWRDTLRFLLDQFGDDRILYAGNWPLCTRDVELKVALDVMLDVLGPAAHKFFAENARRVYRLN